MSKTMFDNKFQSIRFIKYVHAKWWNTQIVTKADQIIVLTQREQNN